MSKQTKGSKTAKNPQKPSATPPAELPQKLVVRKIPFAFSQSTNPVWNPKMHEWSHMLSGASLTMPYLEPFLIRTMREAMPHITDSALQKDAKGFIEQEAQHFQVHRAFNERLKANGYGELAQIEEQMQAEYARYQDKPLAWRMAYTAGFETMTMGVTDWLINYRRKLFGGADASVASFVLWHMVEETEHKTVAFDVYQHLFGGYWQRFRGVFTGSWSVLKFTHRAYRLMLKKDGKWRNLPSRWRLLKMQTFFLAYVGSTLLRSLLPGHHPTRVQDPEWVAQWASAYEGLADDEIPLLDTGHPEIPARFEG